MAQAKTITISRLREIIDLCKDKGVCKISIPGSIELELFPFAINIGSSLGPDDIGNESKTVHTDEEADLELLLHSAH